MVRTKDREDNKLVPLIYEPEIEHVKADFINTEYIVEPDYFNYRIDNHYIRIHKDGEVITAPRVSHIMDKCAPMSYGLLYFFQSYSKEKAHFLSENSANYGTIFHILCGEILRGESLRLTEGYLQFRMGELCEKNGFDFIDLLAWYKEKKRNLAKDLFGFINFCQEFKVKPIAIEYPIIHPGGLWGGTIDMVVKMTVPLLKSEIKKGMKPVEVVALGDIKSGTGDTFYEENEIQLHAYETLWTMEYPELKPDILFNYGCKDFRFPFRPSNSRTRPFRYKDQTHSKYAYKWPLWIQEFYGDPVNSFDPTKYKFKEIDVDINTDLKEIEWETNIIEDLKGV